MINVDILLATYNSEPFICELLDSILLQSYSSWNLIIRDDCSEDATFSIIEKYAKKDRRIKIVKDDLGRLGPSGNFSRLISISTELLVMFADHDDFWFPDKVKLLVDKYLQLNEDCPLLIHCDALITDKNLRSTGKTFLKGRVNNKGLHSMIYTGFVQGASMVINRQLISIITPLPQDVLYDYYIALVSEAFGKRIVIDTPCMYYRLHDRNVIGKPRIPFWKMFQKWLHKDFAIMGSGEKNTLTSFYKCYKNRILPDDKKMLEKCLNIEACKGSKLLHLYYILRYRFNSDGSVLKLFVKEIFR